MVATESIQAQNVSFDQFFVQMAGMVSACGTCLFERLLVKYSTRDAIPYVFSYFKAGTLVEMCKLDPVSNTFMWLQFVPGTQQAEQWPHSFTYLWILQNPELYMKLMRFVIKKKKKSNTLTISVNNWLNEALTTLSHPGEVNWGDCVFNLLWEP